MKNTAARVIITILSILTIAAILLGLYIHVFGRGFSFTGSLGTVSDKVSFDEMPDEIYFDVDASRIRVEEGDELSIEYKLPETAKPEIGMKNGKLTFKSKFSDPISSFRMGREMDIIVTLPGNLMLKSFSINQDAGNISVEALNTGKFIIKADAGDISLDEIKADDAAITVDAGNVSVSKLEADRFTVDADAGNLSISDSRIADIDAKIDAGNIETQRSAIESGSCRSEFGNIDLKGDIGDVSVKTSVGNASVNEE